MAVPYTFGSATTSIPLSQLDSNFATAITLGNTAVQLGNTITSLTGVSNVASATSLSLGSNGNTTAVTIDTSQNVLVGTTTTTNNIRNGEKLAVVTTGSGTQGGASLTTYSGTGAGSGVIIDIQRSRGTTDGSMTAVASGDTLGYLLFRGSDGTSFQDSSYITGQVDGAVSAGTVPGRLAFITSGSERMRIDSSGNVGIGTNSPVTKLTLAGNFAFSGNQSFNWNLYSSGGDKFIANGYALQTYYDPAVGTLRWLSSNASNSGGAGAAATMVDRVAIDPSGNLLVGTTSATIGGVTLYSNSFGLRGDYSASYASSISSSNTTGTQYFFNFARNTSPCGSISSAGSNSTTYATSSDYRLKENIHPMTGALETVSQLKPVTYKWKEDGSDGHGFIAHELQAIVPECVVGEKDAVNADGNPVYQGIDTSFLVATLTAAIQELKEINDTQAETINALTARVVALESK